MNFLRNIFIFDKKKAFLIGFLLPIFLVWFCGYELHHTTSILILFVVSIISGVYVMVMKADFD